MNKSVIGIVSPGSSDSLYPEGPRMYPGVEFIARGVGVMGPTQVSSKESAPARPTSPRTASRSRRARCAAR